MMPVSKIGFRKPYIHTAILTKKAQFLKTSKPKEYIEQFDSEKIKIMYQTKVSKKSITNLASRESREISPEEIRDILDDETFSNFLQTLTVSYDQTITADMLHDWSTYEDCYNLNNDAVGEYLKKCVKAFVDYNAQLNLINDKKNEINDQARQAIKLIQQTTKSKDLDKINPSTIRLALLNFVITTPKYDKTGKQTYYIIDKCNNLYKTSSSYLQACIRNETNCITYTDSTKDVTYLVKFRADGDKIATYFWGDKTNKLVYYGSKTDDQAEPIDIIEELKEAEILHEEIKQNTINPIVINQSAFNKFPLFDTLEPSTETIYKIIGIQTYTKKSKKEEDKDDLISYAVELQTSENIGIFRQNKFLKNIIKLAKSGDIYTSIMFKIIDRKYFPGDKKGKINTVEVINPVQ